jgi:hypothetical protein
VITPVEFNDRPLMLYPYVPSESMTADETEQQPPEPPVFLDYGRDI